MTKDADGNEIPDAPVTPETPVTPEAPHPLQPGGVRFEEVYAEKKALEREVAVYREQLAKAQETKSAPATEARKLYTHAELQVMVDAGKITPTLAAEQIAWQQKEQGKVELRAEFTQEQKRGVAQAEIARYLEVVPGLNNPQSPEYLKVSRTAWEIGDELGLPVSDPRVQRRALREALGSVETVTEAAKARDASRRNTEHAETGPGAGGGPGGGIKTDALKGVDKRYIAYWQSKGYSQKRMEEEAKFIKRPFPGYRHAVHGVQP